MGCLLLVTDLVSQRRIMEDDTHTFLLILRSGKLLEVFDLTLQAQRRVWAELSGDASVTSLTSPARSAIITAIASIDPAYCYQIYMIKLSATVSAVEVREMYQQSVDAYAWIHANGTMVYDSMLHTEARTGSAHTWSGIRIP